VQHDELNVLISRAVDNDERDTRENERYQLKPKKRFRVRGVVIGHGNLLYFLLFQPGIVAYYYLLLR